jgi:hypothetical protein
MTETPPEAPAPTEPAPPAEPAPTPPAEAAQPEAVDWKAQARKWEDRAKANSEAAKRLQEIEDANKTDLERITAERDRLAAERDAAVSEATRSRVAAATGVPVGLLPATGDEAALTEAAQALLAFRGTPSPFAGSADAGPRAQSEKSLEQRIAEATAAGDFRTALSLQNQKLTLGG